MRNSLSLHWHDVIVKITGGPLKVVRKSRLGYIHVDTFNLRCKFAPFIQIVVLCLVICTIFAIFVIFLIHWHVIDHFITRVRVDLMMRGNMLWNGDHRLPQIVGSRINRFRWI